MDLIYADRNFNDIGVLPKPELDLAFGSGENDFECKIPLADACCDKGFLIYAEGTEYGGIVDNIGVDSKSKTIQYSGRTWHGILGSKCILPLQKGEATGGGKKLPDGCVELEYIASTGTQYLKTGFVPNKDTRVVMDFQLLVGTGGVPIFGSRDNGSKNTYTFGTTSTNNAWLSGYNNSGINSGLTMDANRHTVDKNKNLCYLDGNLIAESTYASFTCPSDLWLFRFYASDGDNTALSKQKSWSCQIYDSDTLVRDYVPILDPSGVACMYDHVNGEYCYNAGTGSFIPGYKLPEGYTEREYIESTGTQYLDTGFKPNQDTRVVMDTSVSNAEGVLFCVVGINSTLFGLQPSNGKWYVYYGTNGALSSATVSAGVRHTVDLNKNQFYVNGSLIHTMTSVTFNCGYPLPIGCMNTTGTYGYILPFTMYSCQIYDNVTPARDYVPVTDANGVACAFDRIGNKTYYNAGSGSFIAGAAVVKPESEPDDTTEDVKVKVEAEAADGASLVDRYLTISGDANACIEYILNRIGLPSALFVPVTEESGVMVEKYQFTRYTDAYTGLCDMLASVGMRLSIVHENGVVSLSAVPAIDYSQTQEFESALIPYETKAYLNKPNHLVCLGGGELENRMVVHLYMDADGNISQTPTFTGLDDYTAVYDYPNAAGGEDVTEEEQVAELIKSGTEKFLELQTADEIDIDFDIAEDAYYIGDTIGTYDDLTGLYVAAAIHKKIVTIKNGRVNVNYNKG